MRKLVFALLFALTALTPPAMAFEPDEIYEPELKPRLKHPNEFIITFTMCFEPTKCYTNTKVIDCPNMRMIGGYWPGHTEPEFKPITVGSKLYRDCKNKMR